MEYYQNIIETIGNTPLVKLNNVIDTKALVLAKVETFNPGNSIKDRMALKMIEDAEKSGDLVPGGVIIEGTSYAMPKVPSVSNRDRIQKFPPLLG